MLLLDIRIDIQNNASKQKVGHCDKSYSFFFIFTILNTYVSLIFHAKIQPKISSGSGEKVDFVVFANFSNKVNSTLYVLIPFEIEGVSLPRSKQEVTKIIFLLKNQEKTWQCVLRNQIFYR